MCFFIRPSSQVMQGTQKIHFRSSSSKGRLLYRQLICYHFNVVKQGTKHMVCHAVTSLRSYRHILWVNGARAAVCQQHLQYSPRTNRASEGNIPQPAMSGTQACQLAQAGSITEAGVMAPLPRIVHSFIAQKVAGCGRLKAEQFRKLCSGSSVATVAVARAGSSKYQQAVHNGFHFETLRLKVR